MSTTFLRCLALVFVGLVVESCLPGGWSRPDVVLLLLVPFALHSDRLAGAWFGFMGGMLLGLLGPGSVGVIAAVYALVGSLLGRLGEEDARSLWLQCAGMVLSVWCVGLLLVALGWMMPECGCPESAVLRRWILTTLVWNLLLLWPFAWVFRRVATREVLGRHILRS